MIVLKIRVQPFALLCLENNQHKINNMHKILVVDDDQSILDAMEVALNIQDYEVETTTKGQETFKNRIF